MRDLATSSLTPVALGLRRRAGSGGRRGRCWCGWSLGRRFYGEDRTQIPGGVGPVPGPGAGVKLCGDPGPGAPLSQGLLRPEANLGLLSSREVARGEELLFQGRA